MKGTAQLFGAAIVAGCLAGAPLLRGTPQAASPAAPAAGALDAAGAQGRTAEERRERAQDAAQRVLFASDEPLTLTIAADFKAVDRDRNPESTRTFPATLVITGRDGGEDRLNVRIRTRGHSRRDPRVCSFAPLRVEFPINPDGTVFEGHKALKLTTHCRDADLYEQYVYRESLVYRIFNLLAPRSYRARLAHVTYVDASSRKRITTRAGLFLEDDDDVASRLDGETTELPGMTFANVDAEAMTLVALFEYMIGNTDMSLYKLHNITLVRTSTGAVYPVPYDFDYSGLVNARYASPDKEFGLSSVRQRLYRGPCRTADDLTPLLDRFRGIRDGVMGLYDTEPRLSESSRKEAKGYLDQFFRAIERPADVKRAFVDGCSKRVTM